MAASTDDKDMECICQIINIISTWWDPITRPIIELEDNFSSLKEAIEELKCVRNDVKTRVVVAERELLKCKDEVQFWLKKVEEAEGEVNAKEETFKQMMRCLWNCHPNCWSAYRLGKWVEKKLKGVAVLKSKGDSFKEVANKQLPDAVEEKPLTLAVGRDLVLETVLDWIGQGKVGVIGIYGMGGVGKTTLLNDINNQFLKRNDDFYVVIWVVVSKELNVEKIQMNIGKRLGLSWPENDSNNQTRAHDIRKVLSSKKFMLLLDDIWKRLDLDKVGIPHPSSQNMSKVIFTTRFEDVCGHMTADKKIKVECLPEQEAMNLFLRNVGEEAMKSHPEIPNLANSVAKECKGLPLALITIGRAMACKKTPQEWKHAISVLSTSKPPSEISGMDDEMLLRLKFSYDNLGGDMIKSCFLYCALFPEDYSIDKEKLIDYWIGEGFLDGWDDDLDEAHNKGHDIIGRLKAACLLETGSKEKTMVKLHDVIRDMALWIASECGEKKKRFLVRAGVGLTHAPEFERWKEAERISLMKNDIKEVTETPQCPNLLTLMLQWNINFRKVHTDFFQFMPLLGVLDLSMSRIVGLPAAIGNLAELRYLNLSYTDITSLPEEIGNLVKLKHLDLGGTFSLHTIPQGAISRLSELRVIKLERSYSKWEGGSEGLNVSELEGLERLNLLNLTLSNVHALERLLCSSKLGNMTRYLFLINLTISNQLSSLFTAMKSLQQLTLLRCNGLVEVTISADAKKDDDYPVSSLECLRLSQLPDVNCIRVGHGCFRNLRTISIKWCNKLKKIYGLLQLESLETIDIKRCKELEEVKGTVIPDDEVGDIWLMQLKHISLGYLSELTSICSYALHFPSLEEINVINCPKLKKLPLSLHSAHNSLRKISGRKEWWDNLQWEEDGIKSYFLPFFHESNY
ncbi:probable disease resistance protein At5g63020 isoform X2 [Magnolia sinica]|uniref:probable disease resistance protein At5g63020 isoform X2 n=1 Tax=Magnolia sinica TaxID=86752 RepID=UPI0026581ADA|nr:probable disease resistance protein At5g63020 isoform X2 [Magnolia sinica]